MCVVCVRVCACMRVYVLIYVLDASDFIITSRVTHMS